MRFNDTKNHPFVAILWAIIGLLIILWSTNAEGQEGERYDKHDPGNDDFLGAIPLVFEEGETVNNGNFIIGGFYVIGDLNKRDRADWFIFETEDWYFYHIAIVGFEPEYDDSHLLVAFFSEGGIIPEKGWEYIVWKENKDEADFYTGNDPVTAPNGIEIKYFKIEPQGVFNGKYTLLTRKVRNPLNTSVSDYMLH